MSSGSIVIGDAVVISSVLHGKEIPQDFSSFMIFIDKISRMPSLETLFPKGVIQGFPQKALYEFLYRRASLLSQGRFVGKTGTSCSTVVGHKGSGKTTALRNFVCAASACFPSVVLVYVTYRGPGSAIWNVPIVEVICDALSVEPAHSANKYESPHARLERHLEREGKQLFLVVDDVDMLYRQNPTQIPSVTTTIHQLAAIGDSPKGRISVVLAGSSVMLENLIQTNKTPAMLMEFPALNGAVDLNSTKYATFMVPATHPLDIEALEIVARTLGVAGQGYINVLLFTAGTTPRNVNRVKNKTGIELMNMDTDVNCCGQNTLAIPVVKDLYRGIMDRLADKNKEMLNDVLGNIQTRDISYVASSEWIEKFKPLEYDEVVEVWSSLPTGEDVYDLTYSLFHLSDRSWIELNGLKNAHPRYVYPGTMMTLFKHYANRSSVPQQTAWYVAVARALQTRDIHMNGAGL